MSVPFPFPQLCTYTVISTGTAAQGATATPVQFAAVAVHVGLTGPAGRTGDMHPDIPGYVAVAVEAKAAALVAQAAAEEAEGHAADSAGLASDSAESAATSAGLASDSAESADEARLIAEAARDAATVNANVYVDVATGLAAVADGVQFQVVSADGLSIQRYRRDAGPVAVAVGVPYPSANNFNFELARSGYWGGLVTALGRIGIAFRKTDGRAIFGVGGDILGRVEGLEGSIGLVNDPRNGVLLGFTTPDGRLLAKFDAKTGRLHLTGDRDPLQELDDLGISIESLRPDRSVIVYGDSMTSDTFLGGISSEVADGRAVSRLSIGGQDAYAMAIAAGAYPLTVTVDGNTIPASGPVNITAKNRDILSNGGYYTGPLRCSIGGVSGVMSSNAGVVGVITTDQWVFTRDSSGSSVSVSANVEAILDPDVGTSSIPATSAYRSRTAVIRLGRNGDRSTRANRKTLTIDPIVALCENLSANVKHILIASPYNGRAVNATTGLAYEPKGSAAYDQVMQLTADMRAQFGAQFIDMRHWAVNSAIYDCGLVPTADDLADMALDCIPRQLFNAGDSIHVNATMQAQEGRFIGRVIKSFGY